MTAESTSFVTNRNRECTACRITSGTGLIGVGLYLGYHTRQFQKNVGKSIMFCIAIASFGLGVTRILDLPPFRDQFSQNSLSK